jgi:hypothetical protein
MLINQYSRISHHTITTTGSTLFSVPTTEDFSTGTWTSTDLALSEFGVKEGTDQLFIRIDDDIFQIPLVTMTGATSGYTNSPALPHNSVQYNNAGNFGGNSGFTFDGSTLNANLGANHLNLGSVTYGGYPITGCGLTYRNVLSASTYVSGFVTGDLTPYGDSDSSSTMGLRNTATSEAKTLSAYKDRVLIVSNDSVGDGFQMLLKDNEMTLSSTLSASTIGINRVIRGTDFHNSAAPQGSATQQDLRSGTYTPSATSITNIASSTPRKCNWYRVGNIVTVCGSVTITTTANGLTKLGLSLPIASNFGTIYEASGNVIATTTNTHYGMVYSNVANDYVVIEFVHSGAAGADDFRYTYSYEVI